MTGFADVWPRSDDSAFDAAWTAASQESGIEPDEAYQKDLVGWAVMALGIPRWSLVWSECAGYDTHRWDGTQDPLAAIARALEAWEDVGVESGTGTGKSFFAAIVILWFLACWKGARVFTFAPKEDQLRLYIWMEIGKLWPRFTARFPTAEMTDLTLRMLGGVDDSWGARGYAVGVRAGEEVATKAAGMHAAHLLIVGEETPGIPKAVIAAHENTCTAPHNIRLYIGNPDNMQDALHQVCTSPDVTAVRISALDHPNVVTGDADLIPGAVSHESIVRRRRRYKGDDNPLYQSRVRGLSPPESVSALIKAAWVDEAIARYGDPAFRVGKPALGVDVANSEGGDKGAVARGIGACLLEVESKQVPDANVFGAEVVAEAKASGVHEVHVGVDSIGVGAGTVNEAKRLGFRVQSLNGGAGVVQSTMDAELDVGPEAKRVRNEEKFWNLRAQMQWQMAQDLQHGRIALPDDPELKMDLIAPTWSTRNGKILVEAKDEVRVRLGRSTDKGDAAVYWNWVRHRQRPKADPDADELDAFSPEALATSVQQGRILRHRKEQRRKAWRDTLSGGGY